MNDLARNTYRAYKSFFSGHNFSGGLRMTAGILLPVFLFSSFNLLSTGILISLGAFLVSVTDNPGPIHHRRNGMTACLFGIFFLSFLSGVSSQNPWLYGGLLLVFAFVCSMLGIFGGRAGGVGVATLIAFILSTQKGETDLLESLYQSLYMAGGGLWYICFSLLLYNFRPYMLARQALGDCIQAQADYLRIRADFYKRDVDYEKVSARLLSQHALIQEKQTLLAEIILKTRHFVKETTVTSRMLLLMYMDLDEMFERITTSYQRYSLLHKYFDEEEILNQFRQLALLLAEDLEETGIAVKSGSHYISRLPLQIRIDETQAHLALLRQQMMNAKNLEGFISLRRIIENIQDLANRVKTLQLYASYDPSLHKKKIPVIDVEHIISAPVFSKETLIGNLSFQSDIFRHALRMTIALFAGFIVSLFVHINHSYWILLTITVILKPAYSLTKKRNFDRLAGTVLGILVGIFLVRFITSENYLLACMIVLMIGAYTYMRTHYFWSVLLMTPYLIIFFHFLYPGIFRELLVERAIDTTIGCVIAFIASFFLFPLWQKERIRPLMINLLTESSDYFRLIVQSFINEQPADEHQRKVLRNHALVSLANLSDSFNRMLNEPQSHQKGIKQIHRFVVLHQMFISYIASFSQTIQKQTLPHAPAEIQNVLEAIIQHLHNAASLLETGEVPDTLGILGDETIEKLQIPANDLLQKRKEELEAGQLETETKKPLFETKSVVDQFTFIYQTASDIFKTTREFVKG